MDTSRVKTIVIFALVILNVALLSFLIWTRNQDRSIDRRSDAQVIAFLNEKNITLDVKMIPENVFAVPNCRVERMLSRDEKIVSKMLGGKYIKDEDGVYVNDNKRLTIDGDVFRLTDSAPSDPPDDFERGTIEKYCKSIMSNMGISAANYVFMGTNTAGENVKALFTPKYAEYSFFDANLDFEISPAGLVSLRGKNLISSNSSYGGSEEIFSIHSILVDFAGNAKLARERRLSITGISLGYYIGHDEQQYKSVLAIPVWQIAVDDGSIFYYDARNGKFLEE